MTRSSKFDFRDTYHALAWFNSHNPARQKFPNILENENYEPDLYEQPKWCYLCTLIYEVLRSQNKIKSLAFKTYALGDMSKRKHPSEIAVIIGVSERTIRRYIKEVSEDLERVFINCKVIPEAENSKHKPTD